MYMYTTLKTRYLQAIFVPFKVCLKNPESREQNGSPFTRVKNPQQPPENVVA